MGARGIWARHRRLSLRDRVALEFAVMALVLGTILAGVSWFMVSSYVDRSQQTAAQARTADHAQLIAAQLRSGESASRHLVNRLEYPPGVAAVLLHDGHRYPSMTAAKLAVPGGVGTSPSYSQRKLTKIGGDSYLAVSAPLGDGGQDALVELYPRAEIERTLDQLALVLAVGVAVVALVGLALGRQAGRRLLQPLTEVNAAADAVAHGDLSARLEPQGAPDLAELAAAFNRTVAALEHRVRADARFAGDVSHELRTPVTTMLNSMALLQNRRAELPPEVVEPVDLLAEDLQRFRRLVTDLLDISRSDGGRGEALEQVVVVDLVRRAADATAGRSVTVVQPGAESIVMQADKRRLERVVSNLVENAEGHGRGCEAVRVTAGDGHVRIAVEDRGPGVEEDYRERVFERFARDGASEAPGVGLGLAIVAQHVRWHGGEVWVEACAEGGARFVVELPVRADTRAR